MRLLYRLASLLGFVAVSAILSGCAMPGLFAGPPMPSMRVVAGKFQGEHPQYQIVHVTMCERWLEWQTSPADAEVHIFYRKPGDPVEHERVCRYHHTAHGAVFDGCEELR